MAHREYLIAARASRTTIYHRTQGLRVLWRCAAVGGVPPPTGNDGAINLSKLAAKKRKRGRSTGRSVILVIYLTNRERIFPSGFIHVQDLRSRVTPSTEGYQAPIMARVDSSQRALSKSQDPDSSSCHAHFKRPMIGRSVNRQTLESEFRTAP